MKRKDYLQKPVESFEIQEGASVSNILDRMAQISFQGRNLSIAYQIWKRMLQDEATIFLGLAGAMVPAGMRKILVYLVENRLIDCLVSTGANLFHDVHETLGRYHWIGSPHTDDVELKDLGIDRIFDTFAIEEEFYHADQYIAKFGRSLDTSREYTTREFLSRLGSQLGQDGKEKGILTSAAEKGVPIYCPAIGDSSIGIALAILYEKEGKKVAFDTIKDVSETARMVIEAKNTGVIYVGGGTPKNFIQQTEVTASYIGGNVTGHTYAIQLTADAPHWGGLSGCTFEEAQSWGKIRKDARMVSVHGDATIALPFIASALSENREIWKDRRIPRFSF